MPYRRCKTPPPANRLAKHDSRRNVPRYLMSMDTELEFWEAKKQEIDDPGAVPVSLLADTFVESFASTGSTLSLFMDPSHEREYPEQAETVRRNALSLVAVSILCRHCLSIDGETIEDSAGYVEQDIEWGTVTRDGPQITEDYESLDGRLHLPPHMADELLSERRARTRNVQWYQDDATRLYVRRKSPPAQPTTEHLQDMMAQGMAAPFDLLATLYPYLPTR